MADLTRLNKYLAERGIASRREADELIKEGLISVNGKVVTEMGIKVDPDKDTVTVNRQRVAERKNLVYVMLNKPAGIVTSAQPTKLEPHVVTQLVNLPERLFPVGRLDKDTTGLLILTNDGTLTFTLTHPSSETEKEYEVEVEEFLTDGQIRKLEDGVKLWGQKTLPTRVRRLGPKTFRIILQEGKNRQIRRICQKVGNPVRRLRRVRIKNLTLGNLPIGKWRHLTPQEVTDLKAE